MINNFCIEQDEIVEAQRVCSSISDDQTRNRAVANALVAEIAKKCFENYDDTDTSSGLHNVAEVLVGLDISDIYINDKYIDVRVHFADNDLCVPKKNFDLGILPAAYMFIRMDKDLSGGIVSGFILPRDVDCSQQVGDYYPVDIDQLLSFDVIQNDLNSFETLVYPDDYDQLVFDYLDCLDCDIQTLFKCLFSSKELRINFIQVIKAKNILKYISIPKATESDKENEVNFGNDVIAQNLDGDFDNSELNELDVSEQSDTDLLYLENDVDNDILLDNSNSELYTQDNETENIDLMLPTDGDDDIVENYTEEQKQFAEENDVQPFPEIMAETVILESENSLSINENFGVEDLEKEETISIEEIQELESYNYSGDTNSDEKDMTSALPDEILNNTISEEKNGDADKQEDLSSLFETGNNEQIEPIQENPKKKKSLTLPLILSLIIIAAGGCYTISKFILNSTTGNETPISSIGSIDEVITPDSLKKNNEESMPVETIDNSVSNDNASNTEGTAVSIPAIEQNLDASILVSNLVINWEVPVTYTTNNAAKRYLMRLGKVLQLNLKTELLLLSKPPITNKIALELEFDKGINQFKVKGMVVSSGEQSVDDTIKTTVENTLKHFDLNMNMSIFNNISGNPILIMKL